MNQLVPTARFERALHRLAAKDLWRRSQIEATLNQMAVDLSAPPLKTHHLSAPLKGLHTCLAGDDCWIVFAKQKHPKTGSDHLILLNIGSPEEVF